MTVHLRGTPQSRNGHDHEVREKEEVYPIQMGKVVDAGEIRTQAQMFPKSVPDVLYRRILFGHFWQRVLFTYLSHEGNFRPKKKTVIEGDFRIVSRSTSWTSFGVVT